MGRMPEAVMMGELNLFWQQVFTFASWAIVLVMLLIAWRLGRKYRTAFYLIAILAACVGAFNEPLYDVAFDLWFYDVHDGQPGAMWSHFTAFGIVQPNWSHSGYVILYATACLYAGRAIYEGRLRPSVLFLIWGAEIVASCVFEVIGTGVGVYTYYGPYVLRIWNYPLVIGVLEGTQTIIYTVLAALLWRRFGNTTALMGLFLLFPMVMIGTNCGIGGPIVTALHLEEGPLQPIAIWIGTFASIGLAFLAVLGLSKMLPDTPVPGTRTARSIVRTQTGPAQVASGL